MKIPLKNLKMCLATRLDERENIPSFGMHWGFVPADRIIQLGGRHNRKAKSNLRLCSVSFNIGFSLKSIFVTIDKKKRNNSFEIQ